MRRLRRDCSVLLLAIATSGAWAAPETDKRQWFQVDMAIFTYLSDAAQSAEAWPNDIYLRYPDTVQRLLSPQEFAAAECASEHPENDNYLGDPSATPAPQCAPPSDERILGLAAGAVAGRNASAEVGAGQAPLPFVLLSQGDTEMADVLNKLKRSYRYHPVFSGSWVQALENREQSPAILIRGGEAFGRHHELEGFIKVSLERYLHLSTDLWLSSFTRNETAPAYGDYNATHAAYGANAHTPQWPPLPTPPQPRTATAADFSNEGEGEPAGNRDTRATKTVAVEQRSAGTLQAALPQPRLMTTEIQDDFRVARTVVLQQNRRMRSGEIHYLDHPLFGVLVKVTPLDLSDSSVAEEPIDEIPPE